MKDLDFPKSELETSLQQTDLELFHQLRAGHSSALSVIYDRYGSLVYGLALRMLGDSQEAEDLTQEIFVSLWHNSSYNPARGSLGSYLAILTRSRAIDKLRSRTSRLKFLKRWSQIIAMQTTPATTLEQVDTRECSQQVRDALAQLPEHQRQILEMAYYEGLSQSEIAQKLNIPLGTVKTSARQALKKLRKTLHHFIK